MAKRDPEKTARNKEIAKLTDELKLLLPTVLQKTGIRDVFSLHGILGSKNDLNLEINTQVFESPEIFISNWLNGYTARIQDYIDNGQDSSEIYTFNQLKSIKEYRDYLYLFLTRTYFRNFDALTKKRPYDTDNELWIGQKNADYGLLITPRFTNSSWENDKSEIRHFRKKYWSIGHILATGLVIPNKNKIINFPSVDHYLDFFLETLVRNSGSTYEYQLAEKYCTYVKSSQEQEDIPLLIPEIRYLGIQNNHQYRLDFCIIDGHELTKIGFELSPWSTHGYLSKTKSLTQTEINEMAKDNFQNEMKKHKSYFRKFNIFTLIYTDEDLKDLNSIFFDMQKYLSSKKRPVQLKLAILNEFFS